jgi:hypothetical protein
MSNNEKQEKCLYCKFSQKSHLDFPCYECRVIDNLEEKSYFVLSEDSKYNVVPTISTSMGINTKPAHKLVWNGYWIDFDSNMPRHVFEHLRDLINKEK